MNNNFLPYQLKKTNEDYNNLSTQLAQKAQQMFSVKSPPNGLTPAKGDGVTDDTVAINAMVQYIKTNNYGGLYFPSGTYMIKATGTSTAFPVGNLNGGIIINTPINIVLHPNATLQAITGNQVGYCILNIQNTSNVTVKGGNILGERSTHIGTTGEWGYGINITGCQHVHISDVNISNCWGDGICLSYDASNYILNQYITIERVVSSNNRRQGMSIVDGKYIVVTDSEFNNTNGTAPQAGIDIEPDGDNTTNNKTCENIIIQNCRFKNNTTIGVLTASQSTINKLKVLNCLFIDNLQQAIDFGGTLTDILIEGNAVRNTAQQPQGIDIGGNTTNIVVKNNVIDNCGQGIFNDSGRTLINASITGNMVTNCIFGLQSYGTFNDSQVTNNTFGLITIPSGQSGGGIDVEGTWTDCIISHNTIYSIRSSTPVSNAIKFVTGSQLQIDCNMIHDCDGTGIQLGTITESSISYNHIRDVGKVNASSFAIGGSPTYCSINGNLLRGINANNTMGLYMTGASNCLAFGNDIRKGNYSTWGVFNLGTNPSLGYNFINNGGVVCNTQWTSGTSYAVGSNVYVGNNVYQCTTVGGSTSTTQPSGTSTTPTTLADGYAWVYLNARMTS